MSLRMSGGWNTNCASSALELISRHRRKGNSSSLKHLKAAQQFQKPCRLVKLVWPQNAQSLHSCTALQLGLSTMYIAPGKSRLVQHACNSHSNSVLQRLHHNHNILQYPFLHEVVSSVMRSQLGMVCWHCWRWLYSLNLMTHSWYCKWMFLWRQPSWALGQTDCCALSIAMHQADLNSEKDCIPPSPARTSPSMLVKLAQDQLCPWWRPGPECRRASRVAVTLAWQCPRWGLQQIYWALMYIYDSVIH